MNSRIAAGMANAVEAMVARNTPSSMQHLVCWQPLLENGSVLLEGVVLLQPQNSLQKPLTQQHRSDAWNACCSNRSEDGRPGLNSLRARVCAHNARACMGAYI
jgi:hypothetical protein